MEPSLQLAVTSHQLIQVGEGDAQVAIVHRQAQPKPAAHERSAGASQQCVFE
jgi:hypothetical protein